MEAFVDSLDMFAGESSSWLPTGLPYEGWIECLGRCAVGLYGPLELLKLHQLVDCMLRNVLQGETIEQAANGVWLETRDSLASWVASNTAAGPGKGGAAAGMGGAGAAGAAGAAAAANAAVAAADGRDAKGGKDAGARDAGAKGKKKKGGDKAAPPAGKSADKKGTPQSSARGNADDGGDVGEEAAGPAAVANADASKVTNAAVPSVSSASRAAADAAGGGLVAPGMANDTRPTAGSWGDQEGELKMQPRVKKLQQTAGAAEVRPEAPQPSDRPLPGQLSERGPMSQRGGAGGAASGGATAGSALGKNASRSPSPKPTSDRHGRPTTDRSSPASSPRGARGAGGPVLAHKGPMSHTKKVTPGDALRKPSAMAPPPPRSPKILLAPPTSDVLGAKKPPSARGASMQQALGSGALQDAEKWFAAPGYN